MLVTAGLRLRWLVLLFLAFFPSCTPPAVEQAERILDFDSRIEVAADGVLTVTETIRVMARGDRIKQGIYRDFPTTQNRPGFGAHKVRFEVVAVLRDGQPQDYFTEIGNNSVRVNMGSMYVFLDPGTYAYSLTYRTDRQVDFFENYDELYWNVTGNDWAFPIERAQATIVLPPGARIEQQAAYTGPLGATGRDFTAGTDNEGNLVFATIRTLDLGEGLTIAVAWPKGFVVEQLP